MQPWAGLARQPQTAENTLLLDYISPNPISTFVSSIKNRHWPVTAVLVGSTLLKIIILISTGLFLPQPSSPPRHVAFNMIEQFQLSNFNSSAVDDLAGSLYTGVHFSDVSYPSGTNASFAVEMFNSSRPIKGKECPSYDFEQSDNHEATTYNLTATAKSFTADLECESAQVIGNFTTLNCTSEGCEHFWASARIGSETCLVSALQGIVVYPPGQTSSYGNRVGTVLKGMCEEQGSSKQFSGSSTFHYLAVLGGHLNVSGVLRHLDTPSHSKYSLELEMLNPHCRRF